MCKSFTIDDVLSFPFSGVTRGRCHLSLDAMQVAYKYEGNIAIFNLEKWCLGTSFAGDCPKWSPTDPNAIAYLKSSRSGVFIRHLDGTERHLGESIGSVKTGEWTYGGHTLEWSFDGRFLAMVVERDSEEIDSGSHGGTEGVEVVNLSPAASTDALVVLEVATGAVTFEVAAAPYETYECVAWHPSGNWLTVLSQGADPEIQVGLESTSSFETGHCISDWHLFDIDIRNGNKRSRVGPGAGEMGLLRWSPDGNKLAFGYSPYSVEVRPVCAMMEHDSDQVQILSEEYWCDQVAYWSHDSQRLFFNGLKGLSHRVVCVDTVTKRTEEVVDWTGWTYLGGLSQDGKTLLIHWEGLNNLRDVYLVSLDSGQSKAVTHYTDQFNEYELPTTEVVEWKSYDGLVLQGVVVSPSGKSMSRERPTIVFLHGGPVGAAQAISDQEWNWFTTQGFQVFAPDFRGSQQYRYVNPPTEEMNYRDVMSGIEWLARNGKCDPLNIALSGFSYGAILGAYIIGQTNRFRAAVLSGGSYGYLGLFELGFHVGRTAVRENDKWKAALEVPDWFLTSAILYVEQVETPVLLFHGEHDWPAIEAEMYANYLSDCGKTVEYVLYKGEGHDLTQNKRGYRDRLERKLRWFRKYLDE
ncbi:MAG: prolyl oligopeptidase family serine peptidase [Candidatus Poribacteria bacterium]|nr:prolyl oligopeptidase family serine peptidase [Candidatus Poribacteria bacterium]MDE0503340.1 prolyl oligopeptidase family serine peptidase [Candidatus Poribacteria bacterium]